MGRWAQLSFRAAVSALSFLLSASASFLHSGGTVASPGVNCAGTGPEYEFELIPNYAPDTADFRLLELYPDAAERETAGAQPLPFGSVGRFVCLLLLAASGASFPARIGLFRGGIFHHVWNFSLRHPSICTTDSTPARIRTEIKEIIIPEE
jgi:hypothetical protein